MTSEQKSRRRVVPIPIYLYPGRADVYRAFTEQYPLTTPQVIVRKVFVEGYAVAHEEWECWRVGPQPTTAPIVEWRSTERLTRPYRVNLDPSNPIHKEILTYIQSLPSRGHEGQRQRFLQLCLVRGSQRENIAELLHGL